MLDALSSRFSISLIIACALHAAVLFGIVLPNNPAPRNRPLQVTLATLPSIAPESTDTIATLDQRGESKLSRPAASDSGDNADEITATPAGPVDPVGQSTAASTPVLARPTGASQQKPGHTRTAFQAQSSRQTNTQIAQTRSAKSDLRAAYLESWRQVVERRGNRSLSDTLVQQSAGKRLTLEVTLDANGYLLNTRVRRSSGSPALDAAAQNILRSAAPFSSFPPALRAHYQKLSFAYDWRFLGDIGP